VSVGKLSVGRSSKDGWWRDISATRTGVDFAKTISAGIYGQNLQCARCIFVIVTFHGFKT
jgi:hypothetical protein